MSETANVNPDNTVWKLLSDLATKKGITEIVINDPKRVFVEREGNFIQLNVGLVAKDIDDFCQDVAKLNQRHLNHEHPILDGNLPDGSRINIIRPPYAHSGSAITIRKFLRSIKSFDESPMVFSLGPKWVFFLKAMVKARMNVIISGGTGVGKTTFMNLLLGELPPSERVVTIEDTLELSFKIPNLVRLESGAKTMMGDHGLSTRELVKNTLRMRPDRIIIGEIRGGEFFDLLQAMNTGHEGSMSSLHANNPSECFNRMENLYLMAGHEVPFQVIRRQIASAVDFVVQLSRDRDGKRVVSEIREITGMESSNILSQVIGHHDDGELLFSGITPKNMDRLHAAAGLPLDFFGDVRT